MSTRKPRAKYNRRPRWHDDRAPASTSAEFSERRVGRFLRDLARAPVLLKKQTRGRRGMS